MKGNTGNINYKIIVLAVATVVGLSLLQLYIANKISLRIPRRRKDLPRRLSGYTPEEWVVRRGQNLLIASGPGGFVSVYGQDVNLLVERGIVNFNVEGEKLYVDVSLQGEAQISRKAFSRGYIVFSILHDEARYRLVIASPKAGYHVERVNGRVEISNDYLMIRISRG